MYATFQALKRFFFVSFSPPQLFVIVVWNFELYMIPLALLLPLAWNYILITSGKDTRQDVVRRPYSYDDFIVILNIQLKCFVPSQKLAVNTK